MQKRNPIANKSSLLPRKDAEKKYRFEKARIWRAISDLTEKSSRSRITVNLGRINRNAEKGKMIIVPGKVLGAGSIDHPITVAALNFTPQAERKIKEKGGDCLQLKEIIKDDFKHMQLKIIR